MNVTAKLVLDSHAELGEGPIWDDERQVLYWVDILGNSLNAYDPMKQENLIYDVGQNVGTVVPAKELDTLYITSAVDDLSREQLEKEPHAGGVFAVRPGVQGIPAFRFDG